MNMPLKSANELRRDRAVLQDLLTNEATSLAKLWGSLLSSEERITDAFFTSERCYLLLETNHVPLPPLSNRQRWILEHTLCGECQNSLAIELSIAPSTVALLGREALRFIGLKGRPSRCHPLPMLAAMAAVANELTWSAASSIMMDEDRAVRVVSVARPEPLLGTALPTAELDVLRGLVEGLCYRDISERRRTAFRTVANQISSIFRRFRVSGRNELVCHLLAAGMRKSHSVASSEAAPVSQSHAALCLQYA